MGTVLIFFVAMVGAGYLLRRLDLVRTEAAKDLNQLVFYVTLPPLIFMAMHGATFTLTMAVLPALGWGLTFVALCLGLLLVRVLRLPREQAGAFMLALGFANTTFLGYPLIQGFYGEGHLTLAILYDLLGTTLAVNTLGVAVASASGGAPASPSAMARRLLLFPPIWALVLGLVCHGMPLHPVLSELLQRLGDLTTPLIMFALGLSLQFRHWRKHLGLVGLVAVGRLLVLPAVALVVTRLMGLPVAYQQAVVLQAAMPTMFYSLTLAMVFGLETTLVVNAIMVTTVPGAWPATMRVCSRRCSLRL
ncbi:MAG: AEC family transporter [Candidatus Sericytochromatia bacterium]